MGRGGAAQRVGGLRCRRRRRGPPGGRRGLRGRGLRSRGPRAAAQPPSRGPSARLPPWPGWRGRCCPWPRAPCPRLALLALGFGWVGCAGGALTPVRRGSWGREAAHRGRGGRGLARGRRARQPLVGASAGAGLCWRHGARAAAVRAALWGAAPGGAALTGGLGAVSPSLGASDAPRWAPGGMPSCQARRWTAEARATRPAGPRPMPNQQILALQPGRHAAAGLAAGAQAPVRRANCFGRRGPGRQRRQHVAAAPRPPPPRPASCGGVRRRGRSRRSWQWASVTLTHRRLQRLASTARCLYPASGGGCWRLGWPTVAASARG
jgi:hypothetical protein